MKPKTPCKDCERRELGCHANCQDYISFTEALREEKGKYIEWLRNISWKKETRLRNPDYKKRHKSKYR